MTNYNANILYDADILYNGEQDTSAQSGISRLARSVRAAQNSYFIKDDTKTKRDAQRKKAILQALADYYINTLDEED